VSDPRPLRASRVAATLLGVLALVVVSAILTPAPVEQGRAGDARLSTHLVGAQGARLLYELADRLGWQVARRDSTVLPADPAGRTIHAVLAPTGDLTAREVHELLERVRAGAALLYVMRGTRGEPMADSLRLRTGDGGELVVPPAVQAGAPACRPGNDGAVPLWYDWQTQLWQLRWRGPPPRDVVVFARVRPLLSRRRAAAARDSLPPTVVGFPLGRGRVAVVADPDLVRNDVLRVCRWRADLVAVRVLEYLTRTPAGAPPRDRILFDEYHHGFGARPGTFRAIALYLSRTASGHMLAQLVLAGLVWLLATAPRALAPRDPARIERRSPLEHVSALAAAYEQVNATRTTTARLLHGLRRRVEHASRTARGHSDDAFLEFVETRSPARTADVALVRRALAAPIARRELGAVGEALRRIETSLATPTR